MKRRTVCVILFFLITLTAVCGCSRGNGGETTSAETNENPSDARELSDGLYIKDIFPYSGAYVEDGSNEDCSGVCAVRLTNTSGSHVQYVRFTVKTPDGEEYLFTASTLFDGAEMTVLCADRKAYGGGGDIASSELQNLAYFTEAPSVHIESLLITYTDGFINVKNITETKLSNVFVYYKNLDGDVYKGGITYRCRFGDIEPGMTVQQPSSNVRGDTSRVVFVTYDE